MKRFLQIVALVVAALLMAQPALANVACSHQACGSDHSASDCCLHGDMPMARMSSDTAMAAMNATCQSVWQSAFSQPGCMAASVCNSAVRPTPQFKAINQRETTSVILLAEYVPIGAVALPIRAARPSGTAVAPTAAKYILFQVFRI